MQDNVGHFLYFVTKDIIMNEYVPQLTVCLINNKLNRVLSGWNIDMVRAP